MHTPSSRMLLLLELLQARGTVSGDELARRLEIDRRSVRRYVVQLQALGIPIEGTRGPGGGYRLRPGFRLPPLMLTNDEAQVVTLGLLAAERLPVSVPDGAVDSALAKLRRVLPAEVRARVDALAAATHRDDADRTAAAPLDRLAELSQAVAANRRVQISHHGGDGSLTRRDVDPYGVVAISGNWYLVGYCHLRGGLRNFRLDRIDTLVRLREAFVPPDDFDPLRYIQIAFRTIPGHWSIDAVLHRPVAELGAKVLNGLGVLTPQGAETRLRFQLDDLDQAASYLLGLGEPFTVLSPSELMHELRRYAGSVMEIVARSEAGWKKKTAAKG